MKGTKKGFTLVELVVVIAIIAVLMALAIITINTVRRQSRNAQLRNDAQTAKIALEAYYASQKAYPSILTIDGTESDLYKAGSDTRDALDDYVSGTYPSQPTTTGTVCFQRTATTTYKLWVQEEGSAAGATCSAAGDTAAGAGNHYDVN